MTDSLDAFSAPVRTWFQETFGEPTAPQALGWPAIQRGEHTLILAPTGSGKTLAAFLWGIDSLYRAQSDGDTNMPGAVPPPARSGVRLLYVSPLKALNNDIERNLRVPLDGIRAVARRGHADWAPLRVAVRTGDTPASHRAAMLRHPPDILITTPESLYLMLTGPRAREMFRTVRTVIVDEIHTLCGNKRGVHLSLSLERLVHLTAAPVQRVGLSATIKPLEEAARFLGGQNPAAGEEAASEFTPRLVTIVDAGYRKPLDLRVVTAVDDFRSLPGDTIWPSLIPRVLQDIRTHRHTLIFANNRRLAERTADRLNAQLAAEESEEIPPGSVEGLAPGGVVSDRGLFAIGAAGPIRAHHGSMSKEARREMEEDLKAGRLPALVGTSSLELGIDIGSVDLVVQLQSPKSVSQGLQRVGRSGHLVGETSVGRVYPTFREDLVEAAAVARGMLDGDVEPTATPLNPLDVLAQQIVAMVAVEDWTTGGLFNLVRQAYAYCDLGQGAFVSVLEMLSGKYAGIPTQDLRARISWDRVNDRLTALPGSRLAAMMNAGTISDTGAFPVYLGDGKTKLGELDEEFVFETRVGDAFLLGSRVWRVLEIGDDRVVVGDAAGAVPRMPFWHGDYPWRPYSLGLRIGRFRGEIAERIQQARESDPELEAWLARDYALDGNSARNLIAHVRDQLDAIGVLSSDTTLVVETFQDAVGEPRMVVHSPYGGRINGAWALALTSALRERTGIQPEVQANDDGILFRFPGVSGDLPVDLVSHLAPEEARERIVRELGQSALFGAHFRMNAARALLLPQSRGRKRTPFWLQRLKAKDLLAAVRSLDDFPIISETYRDCIRDVLDLPHLEQVLAGIAAGAIRVVQVETALPSPVASALLFQFMNVYMYEWDAPKAERQLANLSFRRELLDDTAASRADWRDLLKPEAVAEAADRAQHRAPGFRARTAEELALYLLELGDLTTEEITARSEGDGRAWVESLARQSRIVALDLPTAQGMETRWVPVELEAEYRAFAEAGEGAASERIVRRRLSHSGPMTRDRILERYAFPLPWLDQTLARWVETREIARGYFTPAEGGANAGASEEYWDRRILEQVHRRTLTLLRKEVQPVSLERYADWMVRWQHLFPSDRWPGAAGDLKRALEQLRGVPVSLPLWTRDVLPGRLIAFDPAQLEALCRSGELVWAACGQDPRRAAVRFFFRGEGALFLGPPQIEGMNVEARRVYDYLLAEGASFEADLQRDLHLRPETLRQSLLDLALAELITHDSMAALPGLSAAGSEPLERGDSSLESDLAARFTAPRPLTRGRYRDAKRRVTRRLDRESAAPPREGRWSVLRRPSVLGPSLSAEERAARQAGILLARYGVVMREHLERESGFDWASLYPVFQRMELRGEVRRGYFVAGLSGVQFALPEAVEGLRTDDGDDALTVVNACDPALLPGVGPARLASNHVVLSRGRVALGIEENGERMTPNVQATSDEMLAALGAWLARPNAPRHCRIALWAGAPVLGGPAEPLLRSLGFQRTPNAMER